jgi:hypothetical protein
MVCINVDVVFLGDDLQGRFVRRTVLHHLLDRLRQGNDWIAINPFYLDAVSRREQDVVNAVHVACIGAVLDRRMDTELAQELEPNDTEGWEDHRTWQTAQKNLYLAKTAISFYDAQKVVV